ncbi:helix-turn-helix transcriptional regulator [Thiomicrorhabdus cannonii]|uniref:helix-turn-helix transcriptional regulator n=1 Tax=Thiomicrorhabdus cannonii TaxID=2748011 RepID=UPI001FE75F57|nr:WYL domain-containing protein [Thiomicrorhabdus cannonii]
MVEKRHAPWFISDGVVYLDLSRQQQIELEGYWFTSDELFSLLALYHAMDSLSEGLLAGHFAQMKQRILELLGTQNESRYLTQHVKIVPIASPPINNVNLNQITAAIAAQTRLKIHFWNRHQDQQDWREISPLQLVRYRDRWFVDAFCHQRDALRSFSLEAILDIKPLNKAVYMPQADALNRFYQSSYGIFNGNADKTAVLRFSAYQARWVKDQQWHPQQVSRVLEDGRLELHLPYGQDAELIQDILKFGPEIEVVSPPELRGKVAKILYETLKHYSDVLA